eukprot:gene28872-37884_t
MYEFDEKRFWKYYVAMEQEKCVEIKSLGSIPGIISKYILSTIQSSSKHDDISLWQDINADLNPSYDKFWLYFLTESAKFSMFWLLANSVFLTLAVCILVKELVSQRSDSINEDFRFADAIAVILQLVLWNGRMILSLVIMEIFARLSLIDFDLSARSFGDSRVSQSTLYSLRNCIHVLIDMAQMLILYPLPFPPKYFVAISTVLLAEQLLRLQTRSIHLQDANVIWMYSLARINAIVLWAVIVLYSNVFESSARESYSFIQR